MTICRLILVLGIGLGLASESYFISLVSGSPGLVWALVVLIAAWAVVSNRRGGASYFEFAPDSGSNRFLTITFVFLLLADLAVFSWMTVQMPRGGWDAWSIWNLRARFLYRAGGLAWRDGFTEVLGWSHPDYPLLLPAAVALGWKLIARESAAVPIALAGFFTFGSTGLMAASLSILRGARQGILAGLALAATPFFFVQGALQCADVPVAFFRLASLAAMAIADRFENRGFAAVAGMAAALGAWTKNEGLLWFVAFVLARIIVTRGNGVIGFLTGALPTLAPVVFFKVRVATAGDIFGAGGRIGMTARLFDPSRYSLIARELLRHIWNFGPLLIGAFVLLFIYAVATSLRRDDRDRRIFRTGALALLFTAFGYTVIYLLRSLDLQWLLDTSSDRLILQLWPSIVFVVFLSSGPMRLTKDRPHAGL